MGAGRGADEAPLNPGRGWGWVGLRRQRLFGEKPTLPSLAGLREGLKDARSARRQFKRGIGQVGLVLVFV